MFIHCEDYSNRKKEDYFIIPGRLDLVKGGIKKQSELYIVDYGIGVVEGKEAMLIRERSGSGLVRLEEEEVWDMMLKIIGLRPVNVFLSMGEQPIEHPEFGPVFQANSVWSGLLYEAVRTTGIEFLQKGVEDPDNLKLEKYTLVPRP